MARHTHHTSIISSQAESSAAALRPLHSFSLRGAVTVPKVRLLGASREETANWHEVCAAPGLKGAL